MKVLTVKMKAIFRKAKVLISYNNFTNYFKKIDSVPSYFDCASSQFGQYYQNPGYNNVTNQTNNNVYNMQYYCNNNFMLPNLLIPNPSNNFSSFKNAYKESHNQKNPIPNPENCTKDKSKRPTDKLQKTKCIKKSSNHDNNLKTSKIHKNKDNLSLKKKKDRHVQNFDKIFDSVSSRSIPTSYTMAPNIANKEWLSQASHYSAPLRFPTNLPNLGVPPPQQQLIFPQNKSFGNFSNRNQYDPELKIPHNTGPFQAGSQIPPNFLNQRPQNINLMNNNTANSNLNLKNYNYNLYLVNKMKEQLMQQQSMRAEIMQHQGISFMQQNETKEDGKKNINYQNYMKNVNLNMPENVQTNGMMNNNNNLAIYINNLSKQNNHHQKEAKKQSTNNLDVEKRMEQLLKKKNMINKQKNLNTQKTSNSNHDHHHRHHHHHNKNSNNNISLPNFNSQQYMNCVPMANNQQYPMNMVVQRSSLSDYYSSQANQHKSPSFYLNNQKSDNNPSLMDNSFVNNNQTPSNENIQNFNLEILQQNHNNQQLMKKLNIPNNFPLKIENQQTKTQYQVPSNFPPNNNQNASNDPHHPAIYNQNINPMFMSCPPQNSTLNSSNPADSNQVISNHKLMKLGSYPAYFNNNTTQPQNPNQSLKQNQNQNQNPNPNLAKHMNFYQINISNPVNQINQQNNEASNSNEITNNVNHRKSNSSDKQKSYPKNNTNSVPYYNLDNDKLMKLYRHFFEKEQEENLDKNILTANKKPTKNLKESLKIIKSMSSNSNFRNIPINYDINNNNNPYNNSNNIEAINKEEKQNNQTMNLIPSERKIGAYSIAERKVKIEKYLKKKRKRSWNRKINYFCRKQVADKRSRVKGRFMKKTNIDNICSENLTYF